MLTLSKIEDIAPDQASLTAAGKLRKPEKWPALATDGGGFFWGECQGSGATPYRAVFSETDLGYKCTCPSRKFPCKHSLALMWLRVERPESFGCDARPQWVNEWLERRRGAGAKSPKSGTRSKVGPEGETTDASERASRGGSIHAAMAALDKGEANAPQDAEAEERAARARARNRKAREAAIADGLDALDVWLADQLDRGFAGFETRAARECATMAARLVDAKASGLAVRLERLPSLLFATPETERATLCVKELGALHLMACAYRRQDDLPKDLRADIREAVGWTIDREALLSDPGVLRVSGDWDIVGVRSVIQPDKLRRNEVWLRRSDARETSGQDDAVASALLLDYLPLSVGAVGIPFTAGERLRAELAFYPSAAPLRALIVAQDGPATLNDDLPGAGRTLEQALDDYEAMLTRKPWGTSWLIAADGVILRTAGPGSGATGGASFAVSGGTGVADGTDETTETSASCGAVAVALPIDAAERDAVRLLDGLGEITLYGVWDGRVLTPLSARTPIGVWRLS